jgi:hypothetical protein
MPSKDTNMGLELPEKGGKGPDTPTGSSRTDMSDAEQPPIKRGLTFGDNNGGMPITIQVSIQSHLQNFPALLVRWMAVTTHPRCQPVVVQSSALSPVALLQALNYTVINAYNKKETLYLLKDVTGYFRPGQMAALVRN